MKKENLKDQEIQTLNKKVQELLDDANGYLPKTKDQLQAILYTAYSLGRDDKETGGRSFHAWFKDAVIKN